MQNKKNKIKKNERGFSLLEVLISIFIFSTAILASIMIFSKTMENYRASRGVQRNLENAQFALNSMAKVLRQGTLDDYGVDNIKVYDSGEDKCIGYRFNAMDNILERGEVVGDCTNSIEESSYATAVKYVNDIDFIVTESDYVNSPYVVGKATIIMTLCSDDSCSGSDEMTLQTTVSFRN